MSANEKTSPEAEKFDVEFDFSAYPPDSCFHDRRRSSNRPASKRPGTAKTGGRRVRKERRRRVDPTTFEKQYNEAEIEFMNAMQRYKVQSGKTFPSYGEVLSVARSLGYQRQEPPASSAPKSGEEV